MKSGCLQACSEACPPITNKNINCYRAQCQQTSILLAQQLNLQAEQYTTAFQSRLGKTPWIKPYTNEILISLAAKGIKHLAIACPSFVTDCLETLEELDLRAKNEWLALGGKQLTLIPCMNENELWIKAILDITNQFKIEP